MRVSANWYLSAADAVYQNIYSIGSERSSYAIILSGDHIYKMNYQKMLQQHVDAGADVTVATIEMDAAVAARRFGVIETDSSWRVLSFEEKPDQPKLSRFRPGKVKTLHGRLRLQYPVAHPRPSRRRRNARIHPRLRPRHPAAHSLSKHRVFAFNFEDENRGPLYWRDVGTVSRSPITKPTSTSSPSPRSSTSTTRAGRCEPGSNNIRQQSLSSPIPAGWVSRWIPWWEEAPSCQAAV